MSKKEIDMWDVEIRFRVRKETHGAYSKKELLENIQSGIGNNDMNCIEEEDLEINISSSKNRKVKG